MVSNGKSTPDRTAPAQVVYFVALLALVIGVVYAAAASMSYAQPYGIMLAIAAVAILLLIAPAYTAVLARRNVSRLQRRTVKVTTSVVFVLMLLLGIGVIQDLANVPCAGIMGAEQTCLQSWTLWLSFYVLTPPVLIVVLAALVGVRIADKRDDRSKKRLA